MFPECPGIAYNDEAVLSPCDSHINPFSIMDKGTRICAYHRDKNDVELSTLGAVDCKHLIFYLIINEIFSDRVFLRLIRCDYVDVVFCEFHNWDLSARLVQGIKLVEFFQNEVFEQVDNFCFLLVFERSAFSFFYSFRYIDEKEGSIRVHKLFLIFGLVATYDFSVVKEGVWDIH